MKQGTGSSYFCGTSLFCGAALNIRTLQQRWMIFYSFQITEDGKTPFILTLPGRGWGLIWPPPLTFLFVASKRIYMLVRNSMVYRNRKKSDFLNFEIFQLGGWLPQNFSYPFISKKKIVRIIGFMVFKSTGSITRF